MRTYCVGCELEHDDWAWKYSNEFEGWVCSKFHKPSAPAEVTTDEIQNQRREYFNSTLQPYRNGELSKEYIEAHGTKSVNATDKEIKNAKYVWKDLKGWDTRKASK